MSIVKFQVEKKDAHIIAEDIFGSKNFFTKTFSSFFGESVSKLVLPAQDLASDASYVQDAKRKGRSFQSRVSKDARLHLESHEVSCFDGAVLETMELSHQEQLEKPKNEQRYVIYLGGNHMGMHELYNEIYTQCIKTKHNFVAFNYKNVMKSQGTIHTELDLIYDVISQIERLRDQGVAIENICLVGHSLGAAFATLAAYVYFKADTPVKVFNGRSFSNFATMTFWQAKTNGSDLEAMYKKMLLSLSNFEIEVAEYYEQLPDEYKDYITVEQKNKEDGEKLGVPDGVVPPEASLPSAIQDKASSHKVLSTNGLFGFGHNDPLHTLKSHDDENTADELCSRFILR